MILFQKNEDGCDYVISKHFAWFTDCHDWFIYIYLPHFVIRFSSAGNRFERRTHTGIKF